MQITLLLILCGLTVLTSIIMIIYINKRLKNLSLYHPLLALILILGLWAFAAGIESASVSLENKLFWTKICYLTITMSIPIWASFIYSLITKENKFYNKYSLILFVIGFSILLLQWINPYFLFYEDYSVVLNNHGTAILLINYGPLFWVHAIYSFGITLFITFLLLIFIIKNKKYIKEYALLLVAYILPIITISLYVFSVVSFDYTPGVFAVSIILVFFLSKVKMFHNINIDYKQILSFVNIGIVITDKQGKLLSLNENAKNLLNLNNLDLFKNYYEIYDIVKNLVIKENQINNKQFYYQVIIDGQRKVLLIEVKENKIKGDLGAEFYYYLTDYTYFMTIHRELELQKKYDINTRLYNLPYFKNKTERVLTNKDVRLLLYVINLDFFTNEEQNDIFNFINLLGKNLRKQIKNIFVSNIGIQSVLIASPIYDSSEKIKVIIEKNALCIDLAINTAKLQITKRIDLTYKIGVALYPDHTIDLDKLITYAGFAAIKVDNYHQGQNYYIYQNDLSDALERRKILIKSFQEDIRNNKFELYYQPVIDIEKKQVSSIECLIRWHHDILGIVYPTEFISFAEEYGFIIEMGEVLLKYACETYNELKSEGINALISVNISIKQLINHDFAQDVINIVQSYQVPPSMLIFEITESSTLFDKSIQVNHFEILSKFGIKFALDDFGAGHSSLLYLLEKQFEYIKLDKSLTTNINIFDNANVLINSLYKIAKDLNVELIAEQIENEEQLKFINNIGIKLIQGFIFAKPMPFSDLLKYIKNLVL